MTRHFRKNPHLSVVIVPGHGRVHDVDLLEGDRYQHYAPHLLMEVFPVEGVPGLYQPAPTTSPPAVSVPAAAAVPALHDALAIAARETVPVEPPAAPPEPSSALEPEAAPPASKAAPVAPVTPPEAGAEPVVTESVSPDALTKGESTSDAPVATLTEAPPAPPKNKGGRPRKVKPEQA